MRSAIVLVGAFASIAVAQIPGLAPCAGACLGGGFGGCNRLDVKCICSNTELISELSCCVKYNCNESEQDATIKFANAICAGQNVRNLPQQAACAPGQEPTGAAGATVSVTRIPTSEPTASASSSTAPAPAATTTAASGSGSGSGSGSANGTTTAAAPASTSAQKAAAATQAPLYGLAGLLAGAGAFIALL